MKEFSYFGFWKAWWTGWLDWSYNAIKEEVKSERLYQGFYRQEGFYVFPFLAGSQEGICCFCF